MHVCKPSDKVRAVGYDSADPGVLPTLELRNITVQAFFNGKISESKNNYFTTHTGPCYLHDMLLLAIQISLRVVIKMRLIAW